LPANRDPDPFDDVDHDTTPPANGNLLALAGVLLLLPIVALLWVSSYAKVEPKLGGFPFFIWYQFVWVFLCSACTYSAYRIVLKARPHRRMTGGLRNGGEVER
jgi:membrane protein implicated in regulation of membrane protease activity